MQSVYSTAPADWAIYKNGIWHWKMCNAHNEKREKNSNVRNRTDKSQKHWDAWREENLQVLGNIGSRHHQTDMKEKNSSLGK